VTQNTELLPNHHYGPAVDRDMTMDDVVQLFGAIVENEPEISDAEVVWTLGQLGVDEALARRITAFVPLALGRRMLSRLDLSFSDRYLPADGGEYQPLAGVPEFVAGTKAVHRLPESQLDLLGRRSAEAGAVLAALRNGSAPADLLMAPPVLV
jgi:hypothetical protein